VDSEQRNPEKEHNPAQNELDLGFSQMEPITPKKVIKPEPSLFEKAKGLFAKKEQKNIETQFATRKEPVFGSSGAVGDTTMTSENQTENTTIDNNFSTTHSEAHEVETSAVENSSETLTEETTKAVEPSQSDISDFKEKPKAGLKNPENWAILSILPQKHRRLFVAIFAVVILLIFILWMKPSSDTVQSYEQQSNNDVPIQFQQLDQSQSVEPTVLDNPTQPAQSTEPATQSATGNTGAETQNTTNAAQQAEPQTPPAMEQPTVAENKPTEVKSTTEGTVSVEPGKPQEVVKPQETVKKSEPVKAEKAKTEKTSKAENAAKAQQGKKQQSKEQQAKTEKQVVDILEGRSSGSKPAPAGSKTLTVPQGVTLMQVFRDNKLPIADVNAMTKAHGAGNALSRFKPGDKVQVSLNSQGRVSEMRLSNGSRFVRQSDGSYQFKK
jgi:opacity-associated protein oapA